MHRFHKKEQAISFIEEHFPVSEHHHIANADVKRNKEFFVLKQLIHTNDSIIHYPIEFHHCGNESGFPDFVILLNEESYLVEVSEITNRESQLMFRHHQRIDIGGVIGNVDLTDEVRTIVNRKNAKLDRYRQNTKIHNSILLIDHNQWPPFSYGSPGDDLRLEEIKSLFDHTFIFVPIYGVNRNYLKL